MTAFPFSAVVGQDDAKLALLLNAIDRRIGGVLLRGHKGSAKSTLARGLASLLPGNAPFVELPIGATEDRLVGTLDVAAALTGGEVRLLPGLLHAADGGVLYVDEVNLLPDHLVDVLLDVAASGVNRVEREGVSESHPSRFVLIGSMNPEEGELRPQLLDRFGLAVDVVALDEPATRAEAVARRLAFDADADAFVAKAAADERDLRDRLVAASRSTSPVSADLLAVIARLCASVGAEGLRADIVIARAAAALAAWDGRDAADVEHVRGVAAMALAHRRRRSPFEAPGIDDDELADALAHALEPSRADDAPEPSRADDAPDDGAPEPSRADDAADDAPEPSRADDAPADGAPARPRTDDAPEPSRAPGDDAPARPRTDDAPEPSHARDYDAPAADQRVVAPDEASSANVVALAVDRTDGGPSGRRSTTLGARGRVVGDRAPEGPVASVAIGATVRAVAARRVAGGPIAVAADDVREAVRETKAGNLVVLAVDASGSMGAERRMAAAKGAVVSLLLDAYQRRDRVALVTFRGDGADVVLRPTGSVEVARARLAELATGGRTPLAQGIATALSVATAPSDGRAPLLVLLTDGRATAAPPGADDAVAAAMAAAAEVRRRGVRAVVVDAEDGPTRLGLAARLADAMGARHLTMAELTAGALESAIRNA